MIRVRRLSAIAAVLILAALAAPADAQDRRVPGSTAEMTLSFAPVAQRVSPSVVNPGGACGVVVWMPRTCAGNLPPRIVVITPPQSPPWAANLR